MNHSPPTWLNEEANWPVFVVHCPYGHWLVPIIYTVHSIVLRRRARDPHTNNAPSYLRHLATYHLVGLSALVQEHPRRVGCRNASTVVVALHTFIHCTQVNQIHVLEPSLSLIPFYPNHLWLLCSFLTLWSIPDRCHIGLRHSMSSVNRKTDSLKSWLEPALTQHLMLAKLYTKLKKQNGSIYHSKKGLHSIIPKEKWINWRTLPPDSQDEFTQVA